MGLTLAFRAALAALATLSLAGCAVGPRYVAPTPPSAATGAFISSSSNAAAPTAPPDQWWRLYQDPVLDRLVQQALTENQDLKIAVANLQYAQALVGEARAGLYPTTSLSAGESYGRTSTAELAEDLGGPKAKSIWLGSIGAASAYQLDLFGRVRRTIEAAHASAEAQRAAADAVRVTVVAETTAAYIDACGYAEQAEVARRSMALVEQTYAITARSRAAGSATDLDVDRQATLLDQAKGLIPTLDGERRSSLFELAALIGKPPSAVPADAAACTRPPAIAQALPVGDGAALLRRRPDVSQAERQLAAATARIGVAAADLYPTITLNGSVNGFGPTTASLTSASGLSFGIGPMLTWSFPNVSVARAHVREAAAQTSAALASFDSVVVQALKEAEQALAAYAGEIDHHQALAAASEHAARAFDLAKIQYRDGYISGLDLNSAETVAIDADQALAASDQQLAIDQVAVFQALGGGWQAAPPVAPPGLAAR